MNQLIKQLASPTGLLYVFMVLTQIVTGVYAASGVEPPASFTLIYILGFLWIMGWWLRVDSRTRGVAWVFDMGLFLYVAWPFILPYYVLKSRGRKGLLAILCFVAVYIAATLVGVALYLVFAPRSWPVASKNPSNCVNSQNRPVLLLSKMKFVLPLFAVLIICANALAQQQPNMPQNCESDIAILDVASRKAGDDGLIIAIARLGDGERQRRINLRRLHNVGVYLTEWDGRRSRNTLVLAEGERRGYGRVELYVRGELFHSLLLRPNADLLVGSCTYEINSPQEQERENNLYPWRDGLQPGSKKKRSK